MDIKCYFVKLVALYSNKILYGYNCNIDSLYEQIYEAKRFYILEQNTDACGLYGDVIDELNKFKKRINTTASTFCVDCTEPVELTCKDINLTLTNTSSGNNYTFYATVTNATAPINYSWTYDTSVWSLVNQTNNYIVLQAIAPDGVPVYTNIGVSVTDANDCLISTYNFVDYKKETQVCIGYTAEICTSGNSETYSAGQYNGRNYYILYCSNTTTIIGYIFWNSTLNRWEFRDELSSTGNLYSYLNENTYYPVGNWINQAVEVATIVKATSGPCNEQLT